MTELALVLGGFISKFTAVPVYVPFGATPKVNGSVFEPDVIVHPLAGLTEMAYARPVTLQVNETC